MKPTIILIGTGAVGSYYAGRLAQAGARVSTVCRSDYEEVKKNGIRINSVDGDFSFMPEMVIKRASEYPEKPDFIIVATKVLPEISVPALIGDAAGPETSIVLIQNGIGIEKSIQEAYPDNEIINGLAFICASREKYGEIKHEDYGRMVLGRYPSGESEKAKILRELFLSSGVNCEIETNSTTARFKKLLWNAPFNPMSVLAGGASTREMMGAEPTLNTVKMVMGEVVRLANATGHKIPYTAIQENLDYTAAMTPYKTSMLLDYENGRPMEVDAILGNTVRLARENGVDVPCIETLYGLLSLLNRKNIS